MKLELSLLYKKSVTNCLHPTNTALDCLHFGETLLKDYFMNLLYAFELHSCRGTVQNMLSGDCDVIYGLKSLDSCSTFQFITRRAAPLTSAYISYEQFIFTYTYTQTNLALDRFTQKTHTSITNVKG